MLAYRALAQRYVRRLEDAFGQRSLLGTREPIVDVEAETAMLRTLIFQIIVGEFFYLNVYFLHKTQRLPPTPAQSVER